MSIQASKNITPEEVKAGVLTTKQVLISSQQGPHFALRKFTIQPGGSMPMHTNSVEHEQYVLQGRARVVIGDETFTAQKDDAVFIPAGVAHSYTTLGDEPFAFLCIVPNEQDVIELVK